MKRPMKKKETVRLQANLTGEISVTTLHKVLKLLESEGAELGPIRVPGIRGEKLPDAIEHLGAVVSSPRVTQKVLGRSFAQARRLKVPDLCGGIRDPHVHLADQILVMDRTAFDKVILEAQLDFKRLEAAASLGK